MSWNSILDKEDVDTAFDCFWGDFTDLYNLYFPLTKFKFNKNVHKINNYMNLYQERKNLNYVRKPLRTGLRNPSRVTEFAGIFSTHL